jgi:hypothetical protein
MSKYTFALGQVRTLNADGRRPQVIIVKDQETRKELAEILYDDAARVLLREFAPDKLP